MIVSRARRLNCVTCQETGKQPSSALCFHAVDRFNKCTIVLNVIAARPSKGCRVIALL